MRTLLPIALALCLMAGCKKAGNKDTADGQGKAPAVHAPTGVVMNPGGGGSGGAVQAVRTAVTRAVNQIELNQLHTLIEAASLASGKMPTAEEITAGLRQEAPQIYKLVEEKAIILTGTRSRENVWAYTADPQSAAGEHLVLTSSGVQRVAADDLRQRLTQQQGR